ncbi:MAG: DNA polymerase III subunit delta [Candidatus Eisenbacteria bacterium]|nr:DNA polymerase III subunit delta [Candidatus Eisenbacteria bacterium]
MTFADFQKAVAAGNVPPVIVLHGDEPFLASLGIEILKRCLLSPGSEAFDFVSLSGRDTTVEAIAAHAATVPMLSEKRLAVVYEFSGLSPTQRTQLLTYVRRPVESACVALVSFERLSGQNKFEKELLSAAAAVECDRAVGEQLAAIVRKMCQRRGREIEEDAMAALIDWTDGRLSRISNELDKLDCFAASGGRITLEEVEQIVGARASGLKDLAAAIAEGRPGPALALLDELVDGGLDPAQVVTQLYGFWVSMWLVRASKGRSPRGQARWAYGGLLPAHAELARLSQSRTSTEYALGIGRFYRADVDIRKGMPPLPTVGLLVYELASGAM